MRRYESTIHAYEDGYESCTIHRGYDPNLSTCPAASCTDVDAIRTAHNTLYSSCTPDCGSAECVAAFQLILMAHDSCGDDDVPGIIEVALHDFEDVCEAALCNSVSSPIDLDATAC